MVPEVGISGSSGYINIPIHVLYKTEYINSVVAGRGRKYRVFGSCMKKCKQSINVTLNKCKDYVNSIMRGFYQEYIFNNVDAKTKCNLISYIKSLNLDIRECVAEDDGTRVIKVDISPIKKKPHLMNDLLVFIENEKLKMARRADIMSKSQGDKEDDNQSDSTQSHRDESSGAECITFSENIDEIQLESYVSTSCESNKKPLWKGKETKGSKNQCKNDSITSLTKSNSSLTHKNKSVVISDSDKSYVSNPPTKTEKKDKYCMDKIISFPISKPTSSDKYYSSSINKKNIDEFSVTTEDKYDTSRTQNSKVIHTDDSRINIVLPTKIKPDSENNRVGLNNRISTGIGLFWNTESIMYNDQRINIIERADNRKEKSVNVLSVLRKKGNKIAETPYYTKDKLPQTEESKRKQIENVNTTNSSALGDKNMIVESCVKDRLEINKSKDEELKQNIKQSKSKEKKLNSKKERMMKGNGKMCDPSFPQPECVANALLTPKHQLGRNLNTPENYIPEGSKPKKKKKLIRIWKKFFKKNNKTKLLEKPSSPKDAILQSSSSTHFREKANKVAKQIHQIQTCKPTVSVKHLSKTTLDSINRDESQSFLQSDDGTCMNQGDSKFDDTSTFAQKELKAFHLSPSFNRFPPIGIKRKASCHMKYKTVVDKLYTSLLNSKNISMESNSQIASIGESWSSGRNGGRSTKYSLKDFSLSSLDSFPTRTSSFDTVNSVTRIAIKKLAKPFPSMKTK